MRAAIERFYGKIKPDSTALIFFGGYGIQSNRQTYIIPVNAQIWTEADVRRDGFSLDSILAEMNSKGARVKIAILDASRRNPFERRFRSVPAGLAPVIAPTNTAVMYAAAPSTGGERRRQSRCSWPSCSRRSDRRARSKKSSTAPSPACRRHPAASRPHGFPRRWSRNFHFRRPRPQRHGRSIAISGCTERVPIRRAPRTRGEPGRIFSPSIPRASIPIWHATGSRSWSLRAQKPDFDSNARGEYQSAERIGTRRAWEDFLAKYPSGRYSDLARDRLAKLEPARQKPNSDSDARGEYQSAERIGTRRAWEDFLAKYPSGRYSDLARDRLAKSGSRAVRSPIPTADARNEYQSAERIGTRRAWEDFLAKYPSGRYSDLARDRLASLEPARSETHFRSANARNEYPVRRTHRDEEEPGRISSPSIPPAAIPTLPATGSRALESQTPARTTPPSGNSTGRFNSTPMMPSPITGVVSSLPSSETSNGRSRISIRPCASIRRMPRR